MDVVKIGMMFLLSMISLPFDFFPEVFTLKFLFLSLIVCFRQGTTKQRHYKTIAYMCNKSIVA